MPHRGEWEAQQARQMTGCCLAGLRAGGGEKSQKQPRACACRHCSVKVPPSGPQSRSKLGCGEGLGREGSKETQGLRDRDTEGEIETWKETDI